MNRKNLTAAVLAGLAGAAGLAGTAQAVNMNPDGLGQVLIYPYYTTNDGNQTVLSVVNTTDNAKAVKVRFLEGYNSREVLDFNLYMSEYDVWTAAVYDGADGPTMVTFDTSCTVPYFNRAEDDEGTFDGGSATMLNLAYSDNGGGVKDLRDGGPTELARAGEGHFEIIEMGTVDSGSATEKEITHGWQTKTDKDGNVLAKWWAPNDCAALETKWTRYDDTGGNCGDGTPFGQWTLDVESSGSGCPRGEGAGWGSTHMGRNSGGLFGGAAVINGNNGTMFSYDAKAIQGYDNTDANRHNEPGSIHPSLNDGNVKSAWVFFGVPQNSAQKLQYDRSVDAVSAIFMHENIMNEFEISSFASASTEWVITMPTKSWYVDRHILYSAGEFIRYWAPDPTDEGCKGWAPNDPNPLNAESYQCGTPILGAGFTNAQSAGKSATPTCSSTPPSSLIDDPNKDRPATWENCDFVFVDVEGALRPFTETFDGESCDKVDLRVWDREEGPDTGTPGTGLKPPVVSPSLPGDPSKPNVPVFKLCYETNVIRMLEDVASADGVIFGTPEIDGSTLLVKASPGAYTDGTAVTNGWAMIDLYGQNTSRHYLPETGQGATGLLGLPATGFAAQEFENATLGGNTVKAFYGGLYQHKGNVRRK